MIDSSRPGPTRAKWVAAALAMLAAVLLGLVQPVGDVAAQTLGGGNMTLISCAATTAGPICTSAGVPTSAGSRDVILGLDLPSGTAGQTFTLVRFTSNAGVITGPTTTALTASTQAALPFSPALATGQVVQFGTRGFIRDTVPAGQQVACYQVLINGGTARSDFECIVFGVAQGLIPADVGVALNQGQNLQVTWQASTDARVRSYLIYSLGTDGVQVVPQPAVLGQLSATLPGTGGLICGVVIPLDANSGSLGASNLQCGFPGNSQGTNGPISGTVVPGATATRTNTAVVQNPTVTSTGTTGVATVTSTTTTAPTTTRTNTALPSLTPTVTSTPSPADLTIAKTVSPSTVSAGGVVTYTLTVSNTGGAPAVPVTVTDNLPVGTTLLSSSGTNGFSCGDPAASNVMACTGGNLPGNSSATITLIVLINTPCTGVSPFVNTATVNPNFTIFESNVNNNTASVPVTVAGCPTPTATTTITSTVTTTRTPTVTATALPDLSITKTQAPSTVAQNGTVTFTLTVSNAATGSTVFSGLVVQDNLPAGMTFISASGSNGFTCDNAGQTVGCTGGQLLTPGGSATITLFAQVTGCVTPLINTAIVNPNQTIPESSFANNTATSITTVTGCPTATATVATATAVGPTGSPTVTTTPIAFNLGIQKIATPATVQPGQTFNYLITVTNSDPATSGIVTIQDALPGGVTFLSAADQNPQTVNNTPPTVPFTCGQSQGLVSCTGGTIAGGGSRTVIINVLVDNPCVVTSPVRNVARLNPSGYTAPNGQNTTTAGPTAEAFSTILTCAQATSTLTRTGTATATVLTNTPTSTFTVTPTSTPAIDLAISKSASPNPAVANGTLTYTLVVSNSGTVAATNVSVIDELAALGPAQVNYLSAAGDNGFVCDFDPSTSIVGCTGGNIGPNGAAVITILVQTQPGCTIIFNRATVNPSRVINETTFTNNVSEISTSCGSFNTATITSTPLATSTRTPTVTRTLTPIPPGSLSILKVANPTVVSPGGTITWTVTVNNNTGGSLSGVDVTDNVPGFGTAMSESFGSPAQPMPIQSVTSDSGWTCNVVNTTDDTQPNVVCTGGTIAGGATGTITIVQFVSQTFVCGFGGNTNGIFTNTATLTQPSNAINNTASATSLLNSTGCVVPTVTSTVTLTPTITRTPTVTGTALPVLPNLRVVKTFGAPNPALTNTSAAPTNTTQSVDTSVAPQPVTWRLSVRNTGTAAAAAGTVVLTDVMPTGFQFVSFANVTGTWTCTGVGTTTATCTLTGALATSTNAVVDITSSVATTVPYGDQTDTVTAGLCVAAAPLPCSAANTLPQQTTTSQVATAITTVYPFNLAVVITDAPFDPVSAAAADPSLTYTITVTNTSASSQTAPAGWFVTGGLALRTAAAPGSSSGTITGVADIFSVTSNHAGDVCQFAAPTTVQQYSCRIAALAAGASAVISVQVDVLANVVEPPFLSLDATAGNLAGRSFGASYPGSDAGAQGCCAAELNVGDLIGAPTTTAQPPATILSNNHVFELTTVNP